MSIFGFHDENRIYSDLSLYLGNAYKLCFNSWSAQSILEFLKICWQFRCTGLLRSSKLVHLDGKNLVCFTQNSVQNLMNLDIISKNKRRALKDALN